MVVVVVSILLSLCCLSVQSGIASLKPTEVSASTFTPEEAKTYCSSKSMQLPIANSIEDYKNITSTAEVAGISTFWMSGKKEIFTNFKYVDGKDWNREVNVDHEYACAFLDADQERFRSAPCFSLWLGYLCQLNESDSCLHSKVTTNHIRIGDQCFKVFKEKVNWYEARWRCEESGYQLAVIRNASLASQLRDIIRNEYRIFPEARTLWIGLHREDFQNTRSSHLVFWDHYQPDERGICIVARQKRLAFYWQAVNCSQRHHAICQERASQKYTRENPSNQKHITEPPTANWPSDSRNTLRIKSSSSVFILQYEPWFNQTAVPIVLAALLIVIYLVYRYQKYPEVRQINSFQRIWGGGVREHELRSGASSDTSPLVR